QWPLAASRGPFEERCFIGLEPHHCAKALQKIDIFFPPHNSAAGHHDSRLVNWQSMKRLALRFAKSLLAIFGKDLRNRSPEFLANDFIRITDHEPRPLLQAPPN